MSQEQLPAGSRAVAPITETAAPNVSAVLAKANRALSKVRVVHGSNEQYFELSGKQVGSVRKSLREIFNIPGDAKAYVNGNEVTDDFVLDAGVSLEFSKTAGVKGFNKEVLMNASAYNQADYMIRNRHTDTRHLDGLFLELSQFTKAHTKRELELIEELAKYQLYSLYICEANKCRYPISTFADFSNRLTYFFKYSKDVALLIDDENTRVLFPNDQVPAIAKLKITNLDSHHCRINVFNGDREIRSFHLAPLGGGIELSEGDYLLGEAKKDWTVSVSGTVGANGKFQVQLEATGLSLSKPSLEACTAPDDAPR